MRNPVGKKKPDQTSATYTVVNKPIPPAMFQALGRLTVAFQNMEAALAHMIWRVADIGGPTATIMTSGLPIQALRAKVASLLRHHWNKVWDERGSELLARVESLTAERNTLVHSQWYPANTEVGAVRYKATAHARQGLKQSFTSVPATKVEQLANEISEAAHQLTSLGEELYPDHAQRHVQAKPPHSKLTTRSPSNTNA